MVIKRNPLNTLQESVHNKNKAVAYKGLQVLLVICLIVALMLLILFSKTEAYSALLGGMAYIVPNYCFTRFAFRHSGEESAVLALRWFFIGEAIKLIATAIIIALCLMYIKPLHTFAFFAVFVLAMMINLKFLLKNMTA